MRTKEDLEDAVRAIAHRGLSDLALDLVDVRISGSGGSRVVTVTIDKAGGVSTEDCAEASAAISGILDTEDPIAGRYRLDVQSPGIERPLRTPAEFRHAVGTAVSLKRHGESPLRGTLVDADAHTVTVSTDDGTEIVALTDVVRARTVVDWVAELRRAKRHGKKKDKQGTR